MTTSDFSYLEKILDDAWQALSGADRPGQEARKPVWLDVYSFIQLFNSCSECSYPIYKSAS